MTATQQPQAESLLEAMRRVADPRKRRGRRYEIAKILALAVCAMACGARSLYAIAQWGREHCSLVCEALQIERQETPCVATFHRVFRKLDAQAFEAVLGRWLRARGLREGEGLAVDGKTLRGIHGEAIAGVHLVAAFAHATGVVVDQQATEGKGQELEAVRALLERLDVRGHVVTGDALLAQRDLSAAIVKKGALLVPGQTESADAVCGHRAAVHQSGGPGRHGETGTPTRRPDRGAGAGGVYRPE
jgi:hypothetical protein